jgi:predicted small lipoprotein YifL
MKLRQRPRPAPALPGACACLLLGLAGCGQKGPLYLPDPKPQAVPTTPGSATPAPVAPDAPAEAPATRKAPRTPDPATAR